MEEKGRKGKKLTLDWWCTLVRKSGHHAKKAEEKRRMKDWRGMDRAAVKPRRR